MSAEQLDLTLTGRTSPDLRRYLGSAGEVGRDLLAVRWQDHPLGPPESWPSSLSTVVRILLGSRFSMWMAWGPELTFFCNDAYRRDTLGSKYPWALGQPAHLVWPEIWGEIGPLIDRVVVGGASLWEEAMPLFLERSGYVEETHHTFSYSPLTDDAGTIAGMLCVVSEETERVIGDRRMRTLRDLGTDTARVRVESDFLAATRRRLAANPRCLPFTLTYLLEDDGTARLSGGSGLPAGHPAAPCTFAADHPDAPWSAAQVIHGAEVVVEDLERRYPRLPAGVWPQPPDRALVVPLPGRDGARPFGFLVVGLNRYRPLDEDYRGFVRLIAGQIAAGLATARAYEAERLRAESLAELDRAKTAFFTNVSHEFRTPLTLLLGPAEQALADPAAPLPGPQRTRVEAIQRNALRLLKLVTMLLDFSRVESGRATARFEPVDLAGYTGELVSIFRPAVEAAGLTLTVDCPPLPAPVHVDRDLWAKIVLNLLSNALKFTFEGGIAVRLAPAPPGPAAGEPGAPAAGLVALTVTDTGIGIEAGDQERLFERFHRVLGARSRSHEGSGIGLALVAELAALHGGEARVASAPGQGSTFTVTARLGTAHLPPDQLGSLDPAHDDPPSAGRHAEGYLAEALRWSAGPQDPAAVPPRPAGRDQRPRVLVVDDNADMRDYLTGLLRDQYAVTAAADGLHALEQITADPPDLVLTDVMMPRLDGFGLLARLRGDPATAHLPVVMLSARAGDGATIEGLDAGADDYLVKPFSARELLARVRSNLELDRTRRTSAELTRSRAMLDQAQRLAGVGSWELDLRTGSVRASDEFARQVGIAVEELRDGGFEPAFRRVIHPDDEVRARAAIEAATRGEPLDLEVRLRRPDGGFGTFRCIGELERDADGTALRLRGSNQDVTAAHRTQQLVAAAAAAQEVAAREHAIAEELQLSLLPGRRFDPEHLRIATYYRAGVEGTHVGGDWYDVIELGAGRAAFVIGDVMGRGVRAAAVMGQLRAAVRAFARLDLPPTDLLELLDGVVRDLGEDQIVTCLYAVYDPGERALAYANAGHLPPLLATPGDGARRLVGAAGPPLGTGPFTLVEQRVTLPVGATLALYTDGLVEQRDSDIDVGIDGLAEALAGIRAVDDDVPGRIVAALRPDGPDDDIALLLASVVEVADPDLALGWQVAPRGSAVATTRHRLARALGRWGVQSRTADEILLVVSELVTNAILHGRAPVELRVRRTGDYVVVEVHDRATVMPRKRTPTPDDEHGRGLHLVASLADRWGTRPTTAGKSVWCVFTAPASTAGTPARA